MDDARSDRNLPAVLGFWISLVGGPFGLVLSLIGLRESRETGTGRRLALAGVSLSAGWVAAGLLALAVLTWPESNTVPDDEALAPRPAGTTIALAPPVSQAPAERAGTATSRDLATLADRAGASYVLLGEVDDIGIARTDLVAEVRPDGEDPEPVATVLLRGGLLNDVVPQDQFRATVTVTGDSVRGLPVLTVTGIEVL